MKELMEKIGFKPVRDRDGTVSDITYVNKQGEFITVDKRSEHISGKNPYPQIAVKFPGRDRPSRKNSHQYVKYTWDELPQEWAERTYIPDDVSRTAWAKTPAEVKVSYAKHMGMNSIHVDHKVPYSKGGTNNLDNLDYKFASDNIKKADKMMKVRKHINRRKQFTDVFGVTAERIMEVEGLKSVRSLHQKFDRADDKQKILKYPIEQYL
jgi:hypothetical protein|tara:strand:+ start:722 stop:1348 length:627 start_codon:yes stop_codon:yes gene_type:complete